MNKENISEDDKKFAEAYVGLYKCCLDGTESLANFYDNQKKMYGKLIENHYEQEPLKVFKKKHKEWEDKLQELENSYDKAHENFIFEINYLENLMNI